MNKTPLYLSFALAILTVSCSPIENRLVLAAAQDDLPELKRIAAKGVSLDAKEIGVLGQTPLMAATMANGTNVFFYLLAAGVKVDARGRDGDTALMISVLPGDDNYVKTKALIAAGADPNARNGGASVWQLTVWAGSSKAVTNTLALLRSSGAAPDK
jgi:ankyrin repeat protein